jgi:hypothetical protein
MAVLFAFSLQHEVEKYGPYVGLAAFLGLAVLTVLYFAQARELKRLRDWAGRAPERAQELEARVVAQADELRRAGVAEPEPEPVAERSGTVGPAQPVAEPVAAQSGNGRPAGTPAPIPIGPRPAVAVAAAAARAAAAVAEAPHTEAHPAPTPDTSEEDEAEAPVAEGAAVQTVPTGPPEPAEPETSVEEPEDADEAAVQAGNGAATPPPAIPRATPRPQPRPEPAPAAPAAPLRAAAPSRTATVPPRRPAVSPRRDDEGGSRAGRITLFTIGGIVAVALLAFAATQLFGGSSEPKPAPNVAQSPTQSPGSGGGSTDVADQRPDTVVTVLNGTPTDGLAGTTRDKLVKGGYSDATGMVRTGNNTDQQRQDSVVFFARGQRRMARDVAQLLGITTPPEAIDQDTLALANNTGEGAAGHETDVVVIVGLDQSP